MAALSRSAATLIYLFENCEASVRGGRVEGEQAGEDCREKRGRGGAAVDGSRTGRGSPPLDSGSWQHLDCQMRHYRFFCLLLKFSRRQAEAGASARPCTDHGRD